MTIDPGTTPKAVAARMLAKMPGVKGVYNDYAHQPDLYASVPLINASAAWTNTAIGGKDNAGAGIKFATMDGGAHHDAPMFDGTGYSYPPGYPAGGLGLTANNNGKIIVSRAYFRTWDPPSVGDENPWPGTQGTPHGTHTASTAAGNEVQADYLGLTKTISGVAPKAWVMSYRVFYNSITNDGSFYNAEGIAALEDILLDGADVLNNSWGGGPGSVGGEFDPLDMALINVANAGTFVSMSAGNAGPNNGTVDHPSDEYISVAASQSGATLASGRLGVTAPTPVDPSLADIAYSSASFGGTLAPGALYPYNFLPANSVDPTNVQGCNAWPAGTFTGKAALIMRGTCEFGVKVLYAENAGAEFVIVYNSVAGGDALINMGPGAVGGGVTIPSVFIGNTKGTLMVGWYVTNGASSEVTVDTFAFEVSNTPDVIASFSSRGPGAGNVLKPEITAPGVNILAQGYTTGATGEARHLGWGQASGTSMASPHVAGAAALIRQIHPDWSNAAIKSALMSTSKYVGIWNSDATHAQPLDMGAGRLDLTNAADPGVILDPPSVSGGLIVTGATETIDVNVTNVTATAETYDLSVASVTGTYPTPTIGALPGFSVLPAQITLAPGETTTITVTFDSSLGAIGDNQGFIVLDGSVHDAHMPAWVRVSPVSTADVLVIDNDGSSLGVGFPDYASYYTTALDTLGITYNVLDTDDGAGSVVNFLPDAANLSSYQAVIYFTGDNYRPNGTYTVPTPLTARDMDRLTEYANSGGIVIAMGQDLASVLNSTSSSTASFFYSSVLGGSYKQDSVTLEDLPVLPVTADVNGPAALQGILVDLNGVTGDGAHNQAYIDELSHAPNLDPNPIGDQYNYTPLLRYPGPNNLDQGTVAIAHRDQPNLEVPGTDYLGRSIYTTFGLEGVNNGLDGISRSDLLKSFFDWAADVPTASISDTTFANASDLTMFKAAMTSNLAGVVAETYRWDFGDGSAFTPAFKSADASHVYATCGNYTVRVEVTDSWGNKAIGTYRAAVSECTTHVIYMPVMLIDATIP